MNVRLSKMLAYIFGIGLPVLGIVRNWTLPNGDPAGFFIDLAAGGFLLYGAWKTGEKERSGQRYLAAGWGLTVGLIYAGIEEHVRNLGKEQALAAPIAPEWVIGAAGLALVAAIGGLITSLRSTRKH